MSNPLLIVPLVAVLCPALLGGIALMRTPPSQLPQVIRALADLARAFRH